MNWQLDWDSSAAFEAARRVAGAGVLKARLHGHSFVVEARAPSAAVALEDWQAALAEAVRTLDHELLNEQISNPADADIAGWIAGRLPVPPRVLTLHSGANHGAVWSPAELSHRRRYRFEAAHRLPRVPLHHPCGRMHGHGFAVVVQCAANHSHEAIDAAWAPLQRRLHQRCLNHIEGLENPTSEMLSAWIWQALQPALPGLQRITVFETGSSGAMHDGEQFRIWKQCTLDSAVQGAEGPLGPTYGHTYQLRLHLSAPLDRVLGWVVDFGDVKSLFAPVFEQLDHQPLYELPDRPAQDCGALVRWIAERARPLLPQLDRIDLHETPGHGALLARSAEALLR